MTQTEALKKPAFTAATLRLENVSHSYGALPALPVDSIRLPSPPRTSRTTIGARSSAFLAEASPAHALSFREPDH